MVITIQRNRRKSNGITQKLCSDYDCNGNCLFLFQFLNMAKDHWNNYSTNQYAKNVEELPGADSVYLASTSDNLDQQDDNFIKWSQNPCIVCIGSDKEGTMGEMLGNWALYMKRELQYYESIFDYDEAISSKKQKTPQFILIDPDYVDWDDTKQIRSLQSSMENGVNLILESFRMFLLLAVISCYVVCLALTRLQVSM